MRRERSPSYLVRLLGPRVDALTDRWTAEGGTSQRELLYNYLENDAAWSDFTGHLDRMAEIVEESGLCGIVLVHTHLLELNPLHSFLPIYERVGQAAADRGFHVVPTFADHLWRRDRRYWVAAVDPHPNAEGHEILATALDRDIRTLPADCFTRPWYRMPYPGAADARREKAAAPSGGVTP